MTEAASTAWLRGFPALLREAGYYTSNNVKTDYNAPIRVDDAWDECSRKAHWRNRPAGQPFFSVFNHTVTHESCLFPDRDLPLPFAATDPAKVRIPPYLPDTPEIRADWARYYDHLALLDAQIAAKLADLADDGLADDTIVFYYADNGGVLPRSKQFLEQSGTQVPLLIVFPPKWRHLAPAPPGSRIKDPVSFIDFAPTVLSLAGVGMPAYMQGRAFAGPAKAPPREFVFCTRDRMDKRYDMMRSVMDRRWLYIHNYRPDLPYMLFQDYIFRARGYQSWARAAAEGRLTPATAQFWGEKPTEKLYDMDADPDSTRNLAGDPAYRATLQRMRDALRRQVVAIKDNGFLPEGSPLEGYDASHAPGAYPVERVVALADLASQRDPANLARLAEALADPSEPIRWWAAQGCAMLGRRASAAEPALRRGLGDPSGAVQIAAAEALTRLGKPEAALPVLQRWLLNPDSPQLATQAANVLDRMGPQARPALPAMKRVLREAPKPSGGDDVLAGVMQMYRNCSAYVALPPFKSMAYHQQISPETGIPPTKGYGAYIPIGVNVQLACQFYRYWQAHPEQVWAKERAINMANFFVESQTPSGAVPCLWDPQAKRFRAYNWRIDKPGYIYATCQQAMGAESLYRLYLARRETEQVDVAAWKTSALRAIDDLAGKVRPDGFLGRSYDADGNYDATCAAGWPLVAMDYFHAQTGDATYDAARERLELRPRLLAMGDAAPV